MRRALPFLLLLLLPWAVHVRPAEARGGAAVVESLERRITQRLRTAGVDTSRCGLVVIERGPGRRVAYTLNPATPLVPASAAKVLTAAAALDLLGPSHVFRTRLTARGNLTDDGVLQGDLVLHGAGDPSISGRFFDGDAYAVPRRLARAAAEAGVRRVTGALVLDHGGFDRDYVHADWTAADKRRWYGAGVAGLAFNDGCIDVEVEGGARAGAATVRLAAGRGPWRMENGIRT
ncbi:MAG: D-alanyl-D-alanine carboxypeptidase, partial [Planctomycetota bacterium]|nr:D-alanyl-D-alanine carboxypeptidase [Planctomycetota bacterium]